MDIIATTRLSAIQQDEITDRLASLATLTMEARFGGADAYRKLREAACDYTDRPLRPRWNQFKRTARVRP